MRTYQEDQELNLALVVYIDPTATSRHRYRYDIRPCRSESPHVSGWCFTEEQAIADGRAMFEWFVQHRALETRETPKSYWQLSLGLGS